MQHRDKPQKHYAEFKKKHSGKDKTQRKLGKWLPRAGTGTVTDHEGVFVRWEYYTCDCGGGYRIVYVCQIYRQYNYKG